MEELLEKYWSLAYSEGKDGVSHGTEAQDVLDAIRQQFAELRAFKAACEGQESVAYGVLEGRDTASCGWDYIAGFAEACHEHINEAISTYYMTEAGQWKVVPLYEHPDPEAAQLRMRIADLERKYSESVGGFKRDLQEKLGQQRAKNKRLENKIADLERQLANERASAIHTCGPDCQRPGCVERRERDQRVAEACAKVCEDGDYMSVGKHKAGSIRSGEWNKHMKGGE